MANEPEMTTPITRGELHEALGTWAGAITAQVTAQVIQQLKPKFDAIDVKFDAIDARFDAFGVEMRALVNASETYVLGRVSTELREVTKASETAIIDRVVALLDPHKKLPDRVATLEAAALPERVSKLETKVFAPKRRASKTGR